MKNVCSVRLKVFTGSVESRPAYLIDGNSVVLFEVL